jgi:hypothetical protein
MIFFPSVSLFFPLRPGPCSNCSTFTDGALGKTWQEGKLYHIFPLDTIIFCVTVFHGCETMIFIPHVSILFPPQDMLYLVHFKGLCHEINNFFEGLISNQQCLNICKMFFKFFAALLWRKYKLSFGLPL